jgi:transposase
MNKNNKEFTEFVSELLHIDDGFYISRIECVSEPEASIHIYLDYQLPYCEIGGMRYNLYDHAPVRSWQHLSWFEYPCFIVCRVPRYIDSVGKVKTMEVSFAQMGKSYTRLFSAHVIAALQEIKVQHSVANLFHTSPYIVRSIMENAVNEALDARGEVTDLQTVSIDEKAFKKGHNYATILIDSQNDYVVEMTEGRAEKDLKVLFYCISSQEKQPQLERVNIDMWQPYINVIEEIAPQAMIVHDKFHLVKKLSEAIDKTRRKEVKNEPLLKKNRFTVLKNEENRTQSQQSVFEQLDKANLKTAQAWHIRENFKSLFEIQDRTVSGNLLWDWMENSMTKGLTFINDVINTIKNHVKGVVNALITRTDSGKHENLNGRIQAVLAKARGFKNFDRFRINVLFYFGKLDINPLKFY